MKRFTETSNINPFSTNVANKPGSWFYYLWNQVKTAMESSDILSKDAGHRPASLLEMSLLHRCFYLVSA